jgi:hypothetical protein
LTRFIGYSTFGQSLIIILGILPTHAKYTPEEAYMSMLAMALFLVGCYALAVPVSDSEET